MKADLRWVVWVVLVMVITGSGCAHTARPPEPPRTDNRQSGSESPLAEPALAILAPSHAMPESSIRGQVRFIPTSDGVRVMAEVHGLPPLAKLGFHIHEYGDCSDPEFVSAGPHFNPHGKQHGSPDSSERHLGDLGNLSTDLNGTALYERVLPDVEAPRLLAGRSVVIHQNADDLQSQPAGQAGARLACGVIGLVRR